MVASTWHIGVCAFFWPTLYISNSFGPLCLHVLCLSLCGAHGQAVEIGWTSWDAIWGAELCWPKEHSVRWSRDSPTVRSVERYTCRPIVNYRNYAKVDVWRQCCLCQITLDTCCIGMWIYESTSAQAKNIKICASLVHATSSQLGKSQQIILLIKWKF